MASDLRAPTPSAAAELLVREKVVLEAKIGDLRARLIQCFNSRISSTEQRLRELGLRLLNTRREFQLRSQFLDELTFRLQNSILHIISLKGHMLLKVKATLSSLSPKRSLDAKREKLMALKAQVIGIQTHRIKYLKTQLQGRSQQLESMSPLNVLKRGYSITFREKDGKIIRDSKEIAVGDQIKSLYGRGMSISTVTVTKDQKLLGQKF
jgi:exodeoxyribonuclease VII large subunit